MDTPDRPPLSESTILVVDDTRENLRLLIGILTARGYQVRPVTSGPQALAAAQADPPDLILLDIMMPGMDGFETCKGLKADTRTRDIPIIFISALDAVSDKVRAFQEGGVDYITKPFQDEEVHARVATHLSIRRAQAELEQAKAELQRMNRYLSHAVADQKTVNRLSRVIQHCQSLAEAYGVSGPFLKELFAAQSGAIYRFVAEGSHFEQAAGWGGSAPLPLVAQCPAWLRNQAQFLEIVEPDTVCAKCLGRAVVPAICVPLATGAERFGLFYVGGASQEDEFDPDHQVRLTLMAADLMSIALANLQLRERLREQLPHIPDEVPHPNSG